MSRQTWQAFAGGTVAFWWPFQQLGFGEWAAFGLAALATGLLMVVIDLLIRMPTGWGHRSGFWVGDKLGVVIVGGVVVAKAVGWRWPENALRRWLS